MGIPYFPGWWMVGCGFLLQGVSTAAISYSYSILMSPIAAEFAAERLQMMLPITASILAGAVFSPLLGIAVDRFPLRWLASAGVLLLGAGLMLLGTAASIAHCVAVFGTLIAPGVALTGPTLVMTLLARWFQRRRAFAMGIAALGTSVCGFVVPPLIQLAIDALGWRAALGCIGAALIALLALPAWRLVDRPEVRGLHPDGLPSPPPTTAALPSTATTRAIVAQRDFWLLTLVVGTMFSVYSAILSNLAPLALARGVAAGQAPLLISTVAVFGIAGKIGFGLIADRIELRLAFGSAIVLVCAGLLLYAFGHSLTLQLLACVAMGLAAGGMLPVWGSLTAALFGAANYGRVMGLMSMVMVPLILAGSPFAGWSFDRSGDYLVALLGFTGALLLALLLLTRIRAPATA
jgi:MFS family permease